MDMDEEDVSLPPGITLSHVYGDDECLQCAKCGTHACEPLVNFLDFYYNLDIDAQLPLPRDSICNEFVLTHYLTEAFYEDVN